MQQYAVVLFVQTDTNDIQTFREKYDPQYGIIPAHITIVSPFSEIEEPDILEHINKVTQNTQAFSIQIHGIQKSPDEYLFLLVQEGKENITDLRRKLYSGKLEQFFSKDFLFIPHITMGEYTKVSQKALETASINLWCRIETVSLIRGDGMSPAKTIHTFPLR